METPVWTNNLSSLPKLTIQNVEQWASTDCNIHRAVLIKGYSNWIKGFIHGIEVHSGTRVVRTPGSETLL
ncbi:hypothetical protein DPEC_G00158390 [Dallia pectoralis]|uniref:Uncharacterized protein n=1 Tax=Dallia pectoralis TaxID=75939 RepID=A0ACC2GKS3_DALPE|nr:hypothetical protein DPEC_G00158390 [Dallia pectoralis]